MDQRTEARMAANEATFREANERIQARAVELEFDAPVPFLCECGEANCRELVRLTLAEYERVRATPVTFFVIPEHEATAAAAGEVRDRNERYLVVEKTGTAGEVARERDPRQVTEQR